MQQIISKIKTISKSSCILSCFVGHPVDSSTIDINVEFVHSQYSCILTSQVSIQFLCPTKLLIISDNFRIMAQESKSKPGIINHTRENIIYIKDVPGLN